MRKIGGDRQVRFGRIIGLLFALAGGVVIFLGWNGMAGRACVDCQLPYLISGGAAGLGLIVFGSGLLVLAGLRAERIKSDAQTKELIQVMGRLGTALTTNGESAEGLVLAGRSTYHRPECRLVQDKDLEKVSLQVAAATGLTPCRVCAPATLDSEKSEAKAPAKKSSSRKKSASKRSGETS